jgi:hypothetical protein
MVEVQPEDRVARSVDRALLAAMPSRAFGPAMGRRGLLP